MYAKAVKYRDTWLAPGSDAMKMHEAGQFQALDQHLKQLEKKERALRERCTPKTPG